MIGRCLIYVGYGLHKLLGKCHYLVMGMWRNGKVRYHLLDIIFFNVYSFKKKIRFILFFLSFSGYYWNAKKRAKKDFKKGLFSPWRAKLALGEGQISLIKVERRSIVFMLLVLVGARATPLWIWNYLNEDFWPIQKVLRKRKLWEIFNT